MKVKISHWNFSLAAKILTICGNRRWKLKHLIYKSVKVVLAGPQSEIYLVLVQKWNQIWLKALEIVHMKQRHRWIQISLLNVLNNWTAILFHILLIEVEIWIDDSLITNILSYTWPMQMGPQAGFNLLHKIT